jgi:4-carboxymuconolactone decarboxylase
MASLGNEEDKYMHASAPRIAPIQPSDFTPEQSKLARVGTGRENLNLVRTMVNHPGVYDKFISFAEELVFNSHLTARDREVLILKTLALCGGDYEGPIHDAIAKKIGLSEAEVAAARGDGADLPAGEQALVRAADELIHDHFVSDATWAALGERYSTLQLMELVFIVGNYAMLVMATNSFGVQPEKNVAEVWKPY